jgi:MerR family Zn(II)-responsive transcriptional regulator of zntA
LEIMMRQATKNGNELMHIGELARRAGVSVRTLHYYEEVGLVQPVSRTESDYRLYDQVALRRLQTITRMKFLGLKLDEIRRLTETHEKAGVCDPVRRQFHELLLVHIQHIDEQIAELTLLKQTLQQYLDRTESYFRAISAEQAEQRCRDAMEALGNPDARRHAI